MGPFSIHKVRALIACLLISGWAQGYTHANPTDDMLICMFELDEPASYFYVQQSYERVFGPSTGEVGICFTEKDLIPVYYDLDTSFKNNATNEPLREARSNLLEILQRSFIYSKSEPLFYQAFWDQIAPVAKRVLNGSREDIETNSIEWQNLQAFLAFYAPSKRRYIGLLNDSQKRFIDSLYAAIERNADAECLNFNRTALAQLEPEVINPPSRPLTERMYQFLWALFESVWKVPQFSCGKEERAELASRD